MTTDDPSSESSGSSSQLLQSLPTRVETSSYRQRKALFTDLERVLMRKKATTPAEENVLKYVARQLVGTLLRYNDRKSQKLITVLLNKLSHKHDSMAKFLILALHEHFQRLRTARPTETNAKAQFVVFYWITNLPTVHVQQLSDADKLKLVEVVVEMCSIVTGSDNKMLRRTAEEKLNWFWKNSLEAEHFSKLLMAISNESVGIVITWGLLIEHALKQGNKKLIPDCKSHAIDLFVKNVIGTKAKLDVQHVLSSSKHLLKLLTHDDFKKDMLPAMQRAVLRNPETSLEIIAWSLAEFQLDLSNYALEIGKMLAVQLHSKDDALREWAIIGSKHLAQQCSDSSSIEALVRHYFAVLNGAEGKLTILNQRFSVLSGIGALCNHPVSGNECHELSVITCDLFIPVWKTEVHEGTLIHISQQMQLWCSRLNKELPTNLIEWYKSSLNLKVATASVKAAITACVNASVKSHLVNGLGDLVGLSAGAVQRCYAASLSQMPILSEGLQSALLLLRLCHFDKQHESKAKGAISALLEIEKVQFFTDKFVLGSTEESQLALVNVIERLVLDYEAKIKDIKLLHMALVILMVSEKYLTVRKHAHAVCKKILLNSGDKNIVINLNNAFFEVFSREILTADKPDAPEKPLHVTPLIEALHTINIRSSNDAHVVISSLASAHVPAIYNSSGKVWITILNHVIGNDKIVAFLKDNQESIIKEIERQDNFIIRRNCIKTLVKYFSDHFLAIFVQRTVQVLQQPNFHITKEEIDIFNTPEGELYNQQVVDAHRDDGNKNIKRESKLYSYKEQMAEIELRKEIEAKKKEKGLKVETQLNKKQLEAKAAQLEREATIRKMVSVAKDEFGGAVDVLYTLMDANPLALSFEVEKIIPHLVNLFSSPLCAPMASRLFIDISDCIFSLEPELRYLGYSIGYVTLRIYNIACDVDPAWTQEPLKNAILRVVNTIYKRTCRPTGREYDEHSAQRAVEQRLTAPAFVYLHPLLSWLLISDETSEENLEKTLQIVSEHAQMRETVPEENWDIVKINLASMKNPQYLPRKELTSILIQLIEKSDITIEQIATNVLLQVVTSGCGEEGCAIASEEEIKCLLDALLNDLEVIRFTSLKCLLILNKILAKELTINTMAYLLQRVYVATFDPVDKCAAAAQDLMARCRLQISPELCSMILADVEIAQSAARTSLAGAAEALLRAYPEKSPIFITDLIEVYRRNNKALPAVVDAFGRPTFAAQVDTTGPRLCVAIILTRIAPLVDKSIEELANFFVPEALADRNETVQNQILEAGIALVDLHGKKHINLLLSVFQSFLDNAEDTSANDSVRRSVVILMGTVARHLDKDDPKVKPIVAKLIESLSTPSQIVQEAVANCLPHLVPSFKDEAPNLVQKLLQLLLESNVYGERKGAAYGLAGLVKGLGILSLKQLGIMDTLSEAIQDKKNALHREGALFAFEMLCNMLGRLFEPYIIHILPNLLLCFGDAQQRVRQATDDTSKAVMSKLSAHGVKLVLPSLLEALEQDSWRTKAGSIELLGAMAFCAPKQLSSCLPSIVPKLMAVISDSHPKVQLAGAQALKQIGSVIRNPEIQAIVPVLLEALQDPANKTHKCLTTMLNTKFVHFIDAPSLALIMPVIERAFQGRSTETRKMAAQIIGNMYSLTDQKDLSPYLPSIIPGLKTSLLDPVPEVRSVTARALGAMVKGMGEDIFEDLMPWLMATLTSESSSVDRSGAAQGLSEVIGGLGLRRLEKMMPDIIATAERPNIESHVRDGYIMLFIYLPMVFTHDFTPFIGKIISPVLQALADENEYVRDTALKAGQRIVNMYAETAIQLLLPELEQGLFDENWRIRYSSVQLLGDLLYKISGVSGKMTTETADEDDNFGTEQSYKAIISSLGEERRNRVLSGLYMGRSDVSLSVRQAALHVWKVVVTNTPRTLKEILPTLFSLLLGCLASNSYDKQQVAARTLGDLVRKLGERVLPEIIPILEQGLESDRPDQRQGVCIGLSEIVSSTSREMVYAFVDSLVPTVTKALHDPLPEVRQAAAKCFDSLHSAVGVRALDEILPPLLEQLADPVKGEDSLDGLRQVMAIKSRVVLPYLVPQLTAPPVNTRALSLLSAVAGDSLSKHLSKILPALLLSLGNAIDTPDEKQEYEYCQAVILAVSDEQGTRTIVDQLLEKSARHESSERGRRASVMLLYAFTCQTKSSLTNYIPQLLRGLILLFTDCNQEVLSLSWDALNSVTRGLDTKEQIDYVGDVRNAVRYAASDLRNSSAKQQPHQQHPQQQVLLPGFCLKGIAPILSIFREAILNGNPDQKEQAAHGLAEVIELTSPEALKPSVVNIAGPLIRILGDKYSWNVKVAVLDTLSLLLAKVHILLRPFVPQLQQTFLRALTEPASHRQVRLRAANAIAHLIQIHTRCDPVFTEIHSSFKSVSGDDTSVREIALYAFRISVRNAGDKMSNALRKSITLTITSLLGVSDDMARLYAGGCLGALTKWFPDDGELAAITRDYLLDDDVNNDWTLRHGRSVALRVALSEAPQRIVTAENSDRIVKTLLSYLTSDRIPLVLSGCKGVAFYLKHVIESNEQLQMPLVTAFAKLMNHSNNEVKQMVASSATFLNRAIGKPLPLPLLKALLPMLVNGTKEKNSMVKAQSEQALVAVLRLRATSADDDTATQLIAALDPGAREALQDCISKVLKKVASLAEPKEEEFDETLIIV